MLRHVTRLIRTVAAVLGVALGPVVPGAAASTASWAGGASTDTWSNAVDWSGGGAPSGSVDQLLLPAPAPSCVRWQCRYGIDDIPSLTVGTLQINSGASYLVRPLDPTNQLVLLNGLSFSGATGTASNRLLTRLLVPINLGASQTWSAAGLSGTPTQLTLGAVTGEADALTLQLSNGVLLLAPELDTGPLTISGDGTVSLASQRTEPADGLPADAQPLIGSQGVVLSHDASLRIAAPYSVSGSITVAPGSYSTLEIGHGAAPEGTVLVQSDLTLRARSTLQLWIDHAEHTGPPVPSTDYSQLNAFGTVNLGGASLDLSQGYAVNGPRCTPLKAGQVYTLVSATKLVGTFAGVGNGQVVPIGACDPLSTGNTYEAIINYQTRGGRQTVTARIVGPTQVQHLVAQSLAISHSAATLFNVTTRDGYRATFNAPTAGALTLSWTAAVGAGELTVATGSATTRGIEQRHVALTLTAAGRRLLMRSRGPLRLTARATFTPTTTSLLKHGQAAVHASANVTLS